LGLATLAHELAGAEGFEPPSSVLETDSLTVELTPLKPTTSLPTPSDESCDRESYHEPEAAKTSVQNPKTPLFGFFVRSVFTAAIAELRELQAASGRLFVLRRRIIALLAIRTLQCDYFTHNLS
jgi:hypothetical protein